MQKVLVVGASGLVGSILMQIGINKYEMFGTFNKNVIRANNYVKLNVADRRKVFEIIKDVKPELVVDTHSVTNVDYCELHPEEAWSINVVGTKNVAEACKISGAKYTFISSDYVFDGKKSRYAEKDKPHPINYYGKTKLAAEMILKALDINALTVRTAVIYGNAKGNKTSFVSWIVERLKNNQVTKVVIDQYNNPTLADSLAEIILSLFEIDADGLFHVTGNECISRHDFAIKVAEAFGLDTGLIMPITTSELNQIARRPEKLNMETHKVERVTHIKMKSINEGLNILKERKIK